MWGNGTIYASRYTRGRFNYYSFRHEGGEIVSVSHHLVDSGDRLYVGRRDKWVWIGPYRLKILAEYPDHFNARLVDDWRMILWVVYPIWSLICGLWRTVWPVTK